MSFQNFRLDGISVQPAQTPFYSTPTPAPASNIQNGGATRSTQRGPYGSGDMDDGYTLVFENIAAFQAWRAKEEEEKVVEFVKGDTHGSKAVPPRFKDHVKLVCARHSRSGRKKYVKKFPERVRKVPSRKLEGRGCPASISYKTYFDTPEVRVCYMSQHSHEVGPANLPFTSRGRRAQAASKSALANSYPSTPQATTSGQSQPGVSGIPQSNGLAAQPVRGQSDPPLAFSTPYPHFPSMTMPLPQGLGSLVPLTASASTLAVPISAAQVIPAGDRGRIERERWGRMDVLYQSIRNNANQFEYPAPSVAALESVLVRMYFESPISAPQHPQSHPAAYPATNLQLAQFGPPQQQESIAADDADLSDSASGSDEDDDDE
ncbi:hypothetical protein EDB92DRAFT_1839101 [Lactarius akahatsu]|uniref:Uncharacterized protein n=1 Tax=Lactarius akahatsu TaxID=416441 RepID=A0AAD4LQU9_9AGAM|nr:hypothetical protein EDB92DRAFT_1839101 [Lactarius akahatsu]